MQLEVYSTGHDRNSLAKILCHPQARRDLHETKTHVQHIGMRPRCQKYCSAVPPRNLCYARNNVDGEDLVRETLPGSVFDVRVESRGCVAGPNCQEGSVEESGNGGWEEGEGI